MVLLEVIINHISTKYVVKNMSGKKEDSDKAPKETEAVELTPSNSDMPGTSRHENNLEQVLPSEDDSLRQCEVNEDGVPEQSTSGTEKMINISEILSSLPESELRKLCKLLAQQR